MRIFEIDPKKGFSVHIRGFAAGILKMARAFERFEFIGGKKEWLPNGGLRLTAMPTDPSDVVNGDSENAEYAPKSIAPLEVDSSSKYLGIYGFDSSNQVALGLSDCIEANKETGEISKIKGDQYELLVRHTSDSGEKTIGYITLGEGSGEDPEDEEECKHDYEPGGGDLGTGGGGFGGDALRTPAPGNGDLRQDVFPSKIGPCW